MHSHRVGRGSDEPRKEEVNIRKFWVYIWRMWGAKTPGQIDPWFFGGTYPRRNHVFQIWWRSVQGFSVDWWSNFAISHWLRRSSLQHSHTTVWACDWPYMYLLPFSRYMYWCLKLENGWIFPAQPCLRHPLGALECRDKICHQKTRIVGLPDGEEIMKSFSSFWHNTCAWQTDRRTGTLLSQRPALA